MIDHIDGAIDYDEQGATRDASPTAAPTAAPTVVLVPGSCSTAAAWRPIIAAWNGRFRCVTTSLLGYGGTVERRTPQDAGLWREAEIVETVIRRAGGPVHLVGHSFGGLVALAVAQRGQVPVASLAILEAPAPEILRDRCELKHYDEFRRMSAAYFAEFDAGVLDAIARMIDFYGGAGTWASWPQKLRDYAIKTTPANILDWIGAYAFPLKAEALATLKVPTLVCTGENSHPAVRRANELLGELIPAGNTTTIAAASHFMIATHADRLAAIVAHHVTRAEQDRRGQKAA